MTNTMTDDTPTRECDATILPNLQQPHLQNQSRPQAASAARMEHLNIEAAPDSEPNYPTGTKFWLTMMSLWLILILGGLDANIVATAVPSITNHFHTSADVGWYASAFRLCTCAFQFAFAKLYTHFSTKVIFLMSNVIFFIGSLLCATAASSPMFVAGRAVSGLGFAGEMAGCFAVMVNILPLNKRPLFTGLLSAVEMMAIIAAPVVGGALTQSLGWRWCFWYGCFFL